MELLLLSGWVVYPSAKAGLSAGHPPTPNSNVKQVFHIHEGVHLQKANALGVDKFIQLNESRSQGQPS